MLPLPAVLLLLGALPVPPHEQLVVRDVRVATPDLDGFRESAYVVVEGERILAVANQSMTASAPWYPLRITI